MDLEVIKNRLEVLISEINKENLGMYIDKIAAEIMQYRSSGGLGKPLHEFFFELCILNEKDESKDEVLGEIFCRLEGFCSEKDAILFDDMEV
jgi:hypothetical protein